MYIFSQTAYIYIYIFFFLLAIYLNFSIYEFLSYLFIYLFSLVFMYYQGGDSTYTFAKTGDPARGPRGSALFQKSMPEITIVTY